jgi:hypothetical protein
LLASRRPRPHAWPVEQAIAGTAKGICRVSFRCFHVRRRAAFHIGFAARRFTLFVNNAIGAALDSSARSP